MHSSMTRRHFLEHLAGASAMAVPALEFVRTIEANAAQLQKRRKAAILLWMSGGPSTIDIWDLKYGEPTGGPSKPISTTGDVEITEKLPLVAQQMRHLSIVRSMSTREADHNRGRYYMHTGYVPNPSIEHPSYGSVVSHELIDSRPELEIPPFVAVGGGSVGPGFLGMTYAPFVVDANGQIRNLDMAMERDRLSQRMLMLKQIEDGFIRTNRGELPLDHAKVLNKTVSLLTSKQMAAFRLDGESPQTLERYGAGGAQGRGSAFGRSCLMARRLVELGVPFVEVDLGGWDMHDNIVQRLDQNLSQLDQGMSALVEDLAQRGMLDDTVVLWMGEFGRTPRINARAGRDHWARAWSVVLGGGGLKGGMAVGQTNRDGTEVDTEPYASQDVMATVLKALDISLDRNFTSKNNRPMKIANGGRVISELFA